MVNFRAAVHTDEKAYGVTFREGMQTNVELKEPKRVHSLPFSDKSYDSRKTSQSKVSFQILSEPEVWTHAYPLGQSQHRPKCFSVTCEKRIQYFLDGKSVEESSNPHYPLLQLDAPPHFFAELLLFVFENASATKASADDQRHVSETEAITQEVLVEALRRYCKHTRRRRGLE